MTASCVAGLLTTSTFATVFIPFQFRDLDAAQIQRVGYPIVTSFALYSWIRGMCVLSFVASVGCIFAALGYLGLLHERSAADYARCEVVATHDVLITMWLSHVSMEVLLLASFAFALVAVVLGSLRLLDTIPAIFVFAIVACVVAFMVYLRALTLWVASTMRVETGAAPWSAEPSECAGAAAPQAAPVRSTAGGPKAEQPADAAAKVV